MYSWPFYRILSSDMSPTREKNAAFRLTDELVLLSSSLLFSFLFLGRGPCVVMFALHTWLSVCVDRCAEQRLCVGVSSFTSSVFCARCPDAARSDKLARAKRSRAHHRVVAAPLKRVSLCLITVSLRQASALTSPLFHTRLLTVLRKSTGWHLSRAASHEQANYRCSRSPAFLCNSLYINLNRFHQPIWNLLGVAYSLTTFGR